MDMDEVKARITVLLFENPNVTNDDVLELLGGVDDLDDDAVSAMVDAERKAMYGTDAVVASVTGDADGGGIELAISPVPPVGAESYVERKHEFEAMEAEVNASDTKLLKIVYKKPENTPLFDAKIASQFGGITKTLADLVTSKHKAVIRGDDFLSAPSARDIFAIANNLSISVQCHTERQDDGSTIVVARASVYDPTRNRLLTLEVDELLFQRMEDSVGRVHMRKVEYAREKAVTRAMRNAILWFVPRKVVLDSLGIEDDYSPVQ